MKTAYRHGGDPAFFFTRYQLPSRPVIDFSVNTNWMGPPATIRQRWDELYEALTRYPETNGSGIACYYECRYGVADRHVLGGNGSAELMYRVASMLKPRCATVVTPSFHHYERSLAGAGAQIQFVDERALHTHPAGLTQALSDIADGCDLVMLGNPNNPTGCLMDRTAILTAAARNVNTWFLIDEAFISFVEDETSATLIPHCVESPNVIVFHSLTKFYALPGIRLGAVIASPRVIEQLQRVSPPWMVNTLAEQMIPLLAGEKQYETELLQQLRSEKSRLQHRASEISQIDFQFGAANFAMGSWRGSSNLDDLLRFLLRKGIFVRDCRNFRGIGPEPFRFAIRSTDDNDLLFDALCEVTNG